MKINIQSIFISSGHDFKGRHGMEPLNYGMQSVEQIECNAGKGIVGDRYYDFEENYKGQITFLSREVIDSIVKNLKITDLDHSLFRRNVIISGLDLNDLIGKNFKIGNTALFGVEECTPCQWMDRAIAPGTLKLMVGCGGLRCRILESGVIKCGETRIVY